MKKYLMTLAAVLCCTMANAVFNSCEEDEKEPLVIVDEDPSIKPEKAEMTCTLTFSDDMIAMFDLTVDYYDSDGKVQTETVTTTKWTKNVNVEVIPATLGMYLKAKLKDNADPTTYEKFTAAYSYQYSVRGMTADGGEIGKFVKSVNGGSDTSQTMKGDKVADWAARRGECLMKFLYTVDADGNYVSGNWE